MRIRSYARSCKSKKGPSTYVTDIRYREDAADLDKPEDLPVSDIFAAFGNKSLGIKGKRTSRFSFSFCPLAAVFS